MVPDKLKLLLEGCYVTVPTPFSDTEDLPVDQHALRAYVRFLLDAGLNAENATFLAGGAAGDFSTMTFDERARVAEIVIDEVGGRVPVAMGAQSTSTLELKRLARTAKRLGAHFIWPDRYFVPGRMRDYCMFDVPSRAGGDGAMVTGAGGR